MNKKKALLPIVNSRKDLNFQQEDIWTIIDQMEEWTVIAIQNRLHKFWPILNKKMDHFYVFLSCILFPIQPKYGFGAAKLIKTPYMNWRKATDYLFSHADECEDHKMSYNRLDAFLNTQNNPSFRIYQQMPNSACETVESNRRFLKFILRVLQYLGRQVWLYKGAEMIELHCGTMPSIRVISKCYLMLCRTRTSICKITLKHALEILPISLKRPRMLCWSTSKTICKER